MSETYPDITVVGGGFVGLSFALAAARHGFQVSVFDQKPAPGQPGDLSANVIAVNPASMTFLETLDVSQHLAPAHCTPYTSMHVVDGTGTGAIEFDTEEAGLPQLGHIVDQFALLHALAEAAAGQDNLSVNWGTAADLERIDSPLIVAADGAHSRTRESLGIRKLKIAYDQTATVCIADLATPHGACARQWFLESGPLAFLPLSDASKVAVVWSCFEDLTQLDDSAFLERINEACENTGVLSAGQRFGFPLIQQHALSYVADGIALLGDAAHAIHPLAGQGANLGFADARVLAMELGSARVEGRSPGDLAVLKRYERARRVENQMVALAMEGFHRLFTSRVPALELLRSQGLKFVNDNAGLKNLAIKVASGQF